MERSSFGGIAGGTSKVVVVLSRGGWVGLLGTGVRSLSIGLLSTLR